MANYHAACSVSRSLPEALRAAHACAAIGGATGTGPDCYVSTWPAAPALTGIAAEALRDLFNAFPQDADVRAACGKQSQLGPVAVAVLVILLMLWICTKRREAAQQASQSATTVVMPEPTRGELLLQLAHASRASQRRRRKPVPCGCVTGFGTARASGCTSARQAAGAGR